MTRAQITLDTSAVLAYTASSHHLGELLGEIADEEALFFLPAVCLAEAATLLGDDRRPMVAVLAGHQQARVVAIGADEWQTWANAAHIFGSAGAGAAALLVAEGRALYVATCEPEVYGDGIDTIRIGG